MTKENVLELIQEQCELTLHSIERWPEDRRMYIDHYFGFLKALHMVGVLSKEEHLRWRSKIEAHDQQKKAAGRVAARTDGKR